MSSSAGTLVSLNVGMPQDVSWQGRTVFTGVFKDPVTGPRRVRRLNVDGDGQGDLGGHGGEQRAVFVYQLDSYRYWERELGRDDLVHGQFGENFTVEGLADDEVCIGDRYRIGTAVFEVTQPRVTCYRVGIRMNDPRIPALLVSHHRPGFYFRVLEEGEVEAGDEIVKLASGPGGDGGRRRRRAALPPRAHAPAAAPGAADPGPQPRLAGVVPSAARRRGGSGNAGLAVTSPPPAWPGFRRLAGHRDHARRATRSISIRLEDPDGRAAARRPPGPVPHAARPARRRRSGRCCATTPSPGRPDGGYYRITVKREQRRRRQRLSAHPARRRRPARRRGAARHLHPRPVGCARAADQRRDRRHPRARHAPGAGRGALRAGDLVAARRAQRSRAPVRRRGQGAPRRAPERIRPRLLQPSRPGRPSRAATTTARAGSSASVLAELEPPRDAEAYICGPTPFMDEISAGLAAIGIDASRIHTEPFGPAPGLTPGHRRDAGAAAAPAGRRARERPDGRVRPQRPRHPVERRLRQPARARRGMRRARPLVVPHRRLPQLRDDRSSPAISTTAPTRSNRPRTGARSSAAPSRATTSCSTCDRR